MYRRQALRAQAVLSRDAIHRGLVLLAAVLAASVFVPGAAAASVTVTDIGPGSTPDVAVGVDGRGLIVSLHNKTTDQTDLVITHCSDVACTSHTKVKFSVGPYSEHPAIAIGSDGRGIIAYSGGESLKTVHCNNTHCTSLALTAHCCAGQQVRGPISITIDGTGLAVISYLDIEAGTHKLARCTNVACTDISVRTVGSIGGTFYSVSSAVTTGADGLPLVVYQQLSERDTLLKVFHCDDAACRGGSTSLLASDVNPNSGLDITTGADGLGLIVYPKASGATTTWKAAHCSNAPCSAATISTLESFSPGMPFGDPSIAVRKNGGKLPVVAYGHSAGPQIRLAYCLDAACTWSLKLPVFVSNELDNLGQDAALALDADDRPLFALQLPLLGDFRVLIAHCDLTSCT